MALPLSVRILDPKENRFVAAYCRTSRLEEAASATGFTNQQAKDLIRRKDVQVAIQRRRDLIEREQVRQEVGAERLNVPAIDAELSAMIQMSTRHHPSVKLKAIMVAYGRAGLVRDGEFILPTSGTREGEAKQDAPSIYRAFQRTTTTTETIHELHEPEQAAALPVQRTPKTLQAVATTPSRRSAFEAAD